MKIEGRKIKLMEIRQKMLDMQKKYLRLHADDEIENMDRHTILIFLQRHKVTSTEEDLITLSKLREKLKNLERTRYLMS